MQRFILLHSNLRDPPTEESHLQRVETEVQLLLDQLDNIQNVIKILRRENEAFITDEETMAEGSDAKDGEPTQKPMSHA